MVKKYSGKKHLKKEKKNLGDYNHGKHRRLKRKLSTSPAPTSPWSFLCAATRGVLGISVCHCWLAQMGNQEAQWITRNRALFPRRVKGAKFWWEASEGSYLQVLQGRVQRAYSAAGELSMRELITWGYLGTGSRSCIQWVQFSCLSR